jgi:hypothetical protein
MIELCFCSWHHHHREEAIFPFESCIWFGRGHTNRYIAAEQVTCLPCAVVSAVLGRWVGFTYGKRLSGWEILLLTIAYLSVRVSCDRGWVSVRPSLSIRAMVSSMEKRDSKLVCGWVSIVCHEDENAINVDEQVLSPFTRDCQSVPLCSARSSLINVMNLLTWLSIVVSYACQSVYADLWYQNEE